MKWVNRKASQISLEFQRTRKMNTHSPNDRRVTPPPQPARGVLARIDRGRDVPTMVLGFIWIGLLILEFTHGLSPLFEAVRTTIWIPFILNFAVEIILAA